MMFVAYEVCRIIGFVAYDVCRIIGFVAYDVCRIIGFVAHYDVCRLEGLSQYQKKGHRTRSASITNYKIISRKKWTIWKHSLLRPLDSVYNI